MSMLEKTLLNEPAATPQKRARVIAHYLPQFHPIPENDRWWGKGFTEWTNVAKARPMYRGHYQPRVPADLGFYDLRVPETRAAQAEMAREHGVEAFCYWHYWFAGERLLERPFNEVLRSGEPDFPFCLGWANATWSGVWYGAPGTILKEQTYPGLQDHEAHFYTLLEAFKDPRYLTVDGKPFFLIFRPTELPDSVRVTDFWRELAVKNGLKGLHIVALSDDDPAWNPYEHGYDAASMHLVTTMFRRSKPPPLARLRRHLTHYRPTRELMYRISRKPIHVYSYAKVSPHFVVQEPLDYEYYPTVTPNWGQHAPQRRARCGAARLDAGAVPQAPENGPRPGGGPAGGTPDRHGEVLERVGRGQPLRAGPALRDGLPQGPSGRSVRTCRRRRREALTRMGKDRTWIARNIGHLRSRLRVEWYRRRYPKTVFGPHLGIRGKLIIQGPGRVIVGRHCFFDAATGRPNKIQTFDASATVTIGDDCYLNGIEIAAQSSVTIGRRGIVADCLIMDTDFHSLEVNRHEAAAPVKTQSVTIGENVWIGNRTIVLKGVAIGENSVVGAGTVVRQSVPANAVVIGNPQQIVRTLTAPGAAAPV